MANRMIVVLSLFSAVTAHSLPCGHDGPDPFLSIITEPPVKTVAQDLPEAREMVLMGDKVAYRDVSDEVHLLDKASSQEQNMGTSAGALFPLSDPVYLLLQSPLSLLDTTTLARKRLPEPGTLVSASWNGSDLILIFRDPAFAGNRWTVVRREPSGAYLTECSQRLPSRWDWVEGAEYPTGRFRERRGNRIRIHEIDFSACRVTSCTPWTETLPGAVGDTRYFPDQDSYATLFKTSETLVRWETPRSCAYYTTGEKEVRFVSSPLPLLVSWDGDIHVFGLHRRKSVKLPSQISPVSNPRLYQVDENGTLHVLAPGGKGQTLYDVDISSLW